MTADGGGGMAALWRALRLALGCFAVLFIAAFAANELGLGGKPGSLPMATDFAPYWSAASMALQHQAATAYDNAAIEAFERAHTAINQPGYLAFYYPPPFLLACLPFGLLPYVAALLLFIALQSALLTAAIRRILPQDWATLPVLCAPGVLMNAVSGQNGSLTAACFTGGLLFLQTRPLLAGACLGALVYKPQMALAVPVALFCARRWRVMCGAALSAGGLCAASLAFPGLAAWRGFFANAPAARADLETLAIKWRLMQSVYAGLREAGFGLHAAYAGHAVAALAALACLALICARRPGAGPEMAALATTALLTTPFLYDYDLIVAAPALAWLTAQGTRSGWCGGERALLLALFLAPFGARAVGIGLGVPIGPPLLAGLLGLIARRVFAPVPPQVAA